MALVDQKKYEEGERLYREMLMLREVVLGKEHPDTLSSRNNLAVALVDQKKYEEGERLYREMLMLREVVLGKEHPDTVGTREDLASVLIHQGKHEEASLVAALAVTEQSEETTAPRLVPDPASSVRRRIPLSKQGKGHENIEDDWDDGQEAEENGDMGKRGTRISRWARRTVSSMSRLQLASRRSQNHHPSTSKSADIRHASAQHRMQSSPQSVSSK